MQIKKKCKHCIDSDVGINNCNPFLLFVKFVLGLILRHFVHFMLSSSDLIICNIISWSE